MRKIVVETKDKDVYNLDQIKASRRDNASLPIKLQNWYWHPDALGDFKYDLHAQPNPPELEVGMAWISIKCKSLDEMKILVDAQNNDGGDNE